MGLETLICPVCLNRFQVKTARLSEEVYRTTDFRPFYRGDDLLEFCVRQCMRCGYACLTDEFTLKVPKECIGHLKDLLEEKILFLLHEQRDPVPLHVRYESAALISEQLFEYSEQVARLWLMAAWSASDHSELREEERYFRGQAVRYFRFALDNYEADLSERAEICYLIGENLRRMGKQQEAEKYLKLVRQETLDQESLPIIQLAMQQIYDPQ